MKVIFTLLFVILIQVTYAQKYQPLVEEGKFWIYNHHASDPTCSPLWYLNTEIRFFEGDTIIANKSYKKLISATATKTQPYIEIGTKRTLCLMREDTTEKKIYVINQDEAVFPCADGVEVCLWDFGMKVGDTINNCTYDIFNPIIIDDQVYRILDSVGYETNRWGMEQKHFYTVGIPIGMCGTLFTRQVSYVEGFGTADGPILKGGNTFFTNYCEGTMEQCNIISSTKDDFGSSTFQPKIFPNPATDFLTFEFGQRLGQVINQYCIKDNSGQIVKSVRPIEVGTNYIIHTHDFPTGMYIIQFLNDGSIIQSKKFIVSH